MSKRFKPNSESKAAELEHSLPGFPDTTLQSHGVQGGTALWIR